MPAYRLISRSRRATGAAPARTRRWSAARHELRAAPGRSREAVASAQRCAHRHRHRRRRRRQVAAGPASSWRRSRRRTRALRGRCLSYGEGITFWPLAEVLAAAAAIERGPAGRGRRQPSSLDARRRDERTSPIGWPPLVGLSTIAYPLEEIFWAARTAARGWPRTVRRWSWCSTTSTGRSRRCWTSSSTLPMSRARRSCCSARRGTSCSRTTARPGASDRVRCALRSAPVGERRRWPSSANMLGP